MPSISVIRSASRVANSRVLSLSAAIFLAQAAIASSVAAQTTMTPAPPAMSGHQSADAAQSLVNFVTSVNRDEIAMGKLAISKASSADVKTYAQHMIDDHTNAQTAWAEKAPSWSLTIPDSVSTVAKPAKSMAGSAAMANGMSEVRDTTTGLRGGTSAAAIHSANLAAMDSLKNLSGPAFDSAYLTAQKKGHEAVLKELAAQTLARDDMQSSMALYRSTVEKHAAAAKKLQP